jgi:hypothetical protein
VKFPAEKIDLLGYIVFLFRVRRVSPSTIRQYISGLKTMHHILDQSVSAFESPLLRYVVGGFENQYKSWSLETSTRRVFTFPMLQLLAEALSRAKLPPIDAQCIYTAATTSVWSSCRMGDLLTDGHKSNFEKLLTWERTQFKEGQIILYFAHPKTARRENGTVRDVFLYPNPLFCPVDNLKKLAIMQKALGRGPNRHIFTMSNNYTLSMSRMNKSLKTLLMPYLDQSLGSVSCHSFRATLPSLMASRPGVFTTEETMLQGDWTSGCFNLYTRQQGVGRMLTHRKIVAELMAEM